MSSETFPREEPQQERSDVNVRAILLGAAGIVATVLLVAFSVSLLTSQSGPARGGPMESEVQPAQGLSSQPVADIEAYRREKLARLRSYGWVDRDRGIIHVPIERAMQKLAEQPAPSLTLPRAARKGGDRNDAEKAGEAQP